jgi:sugar lactone lactonase YvrE
MDQPQTELPDPISGSLLTPLLITEKSNDSVLALDLESGETDWFVELGSRAIARPSAVVCHGESLFVAGFGNGEILRVDAQTGEVQDSFFHDRRVLEEPVAMIAEGDELWVLGNDTRNIVVLGEGGEMTRSFGDPLLGSPHDMVLGDNGLLYVATSGSPDVPGKVQIWNPQTETLLAAFGERLEEATALSFDGDGALLVADAIDRKILRFGGKSDAAEVVSDSFSRPLSMALGVDGDLYVLDDRSVVQLDPISGEERAVFDLSDSLVQPRGVAFH